MEILAENLGKRFNREWIFRKFNFTFQTNNCYAITGPNGSGKSTLLQILSGLVPFSEGTIQYNTEKKLLLAEDIYKYISISTPYQELIEEFTLSELIDFHLNFKKLNNFNKEIFIDRLQLQASKDKQIRYYSSGMKQRLKLGLAMYTESSILLLDEPTSNLDAAGIKWYQDEIIQNLNNRIVIICSNQKHEYEFCKEIISLEDYKM